MFNEYEYFIYSKIYEYKPDASILGFKFSESVRIKQPASE